MAALPVPYRLLIRRLIWKPIKTKPADVGSCVKIYYVGQNKIWIEATSQYRER